MKKRPLLAYFVVLLVLCAAVIVGARMLGRQGAYLAQVYMLTPAIAALITRLFFYEPGFSDAELRFGRWLDYLKYWLYSLGITALYFAAYTAMGAISWDLSGSVFLERLAAQFSAAGQDMAASLPPGFTPRMMLLLYFIGGLTIFNILPGLISGFGEEFGHRGLMFPLLYRMAPWAGLLIGGLIWFAWHLPLGLVIPQAEPAPTIWPSLLNGLVLAVGSVCTFIYLAYVYVRSRSIFVVSIAHIALNNASMALSYFIILRDQLLANAGTTLVMVVIVVVLYLRGQFGVFREYFEKPASRLG